MANRGCFLKYIIALEAPIAHKTTFLHKPYRLYSPAWPPPRFPPALPADALPADAVRADASAVTSPAVNSATVTTTAADNDIPTIPFDPVPRQRARRAGWSAERQREFIFALARCGSVSAAARHVGMSARTAYRLLDAPGADSFAAAWDEAIDIGIERTRCDALERALKGVYVPIYRRGKLVRVEHRRCDKLAIALLSGQDHDIADRAGAVRCRRHHEDLRALDESRAAEQRARAEAAAIYATELEAMLARAGELRAARRPRITAL